MKLQSNPRKRSWSVRICLAAVLCLMALHVYDPAYAVVIPRYKPFSNQTIQKPISWGIPVPTSKPKIFSNIAPKPIEPIDFNLLDPDPKPKGPIDFNKYKYLLDPDPKPKEPINLKSLTETPANSIFVNNPSDLHTGSPLLLSSVQIRPDAVLAHLSGHAGRIAKPLTPAQQRRALVAMTHEDKLTIANVHKSVRVTDDDVLDIAHEICTMVAESALPTDARPAARDVIADKFVHGLETIRDFGLAQFDPSATMVWARAARAANDPVMQSKVSNISKNYTEGTVSFAISHPQFSTQVKYDVISFATDVSKAPNQPDVEKLSRYPQLRFYSRLGK